MSRLSRSDEDLRRRLRVAAQEAPDFQVTHLPRTAAVAPKRRIIRIAVVSGACLAAFAALAFSFLDREVEDAAECAEYLSIDGMTFDQQARDVREPLPGPRLAQPAQLVCGDNRQTVSDVRQVQGVRPEDAVLANDHVWVRAGLVQWPPSLRTLGQRVSCDPAIVQSGVVAGTWERVRTEQRVTKNGDLNPPYTMIVRTTDRGIASGWTAVRIAVVAGPGASLLDQTDTIRALQQGDPVAMRLRCRGGRFLAESVVMAPE